MRGLKHILELFARRAGTSEREIALFKLYGPRYHVKVLSWPQEMLN